MSETTTPPLVAVLNGPNMNMLGLRQPELYGSATLDDVEQLCAETADQLGLAIDFRQIRLQKLPVGLVVVGNQNAAGHG